MEYSSVHLDKDNKIFLALKDTSQKHLTLFISNLNKYGKDYKTYRFVVKSDFVQNGNHEHMWSRIFQYKDWVFKGVFIDSAFTVKTIKMGDRVSIKKAEIEDWTIDNALTRKSLGGFSIKFLESKEKH
jgi:uncharacterized protein YegJ (DUF2314 family)